MTDRQALAKARKLWGKNAMIERRQIADSNRTHKVGAVMLGMFFEIRGEGDSWAAAFAQAERLNEQHRRAS